jgi:non-specific protein-tyrosine kinase
MSAQERKQNMDAQKQTSGHDPAGNKEPHGLVRVSRTIIIDRDEPGPIDTNVVSPTYYNSFNYALLSHDHAGLNLTVGITSANPGEGKTLIASNFAVSLATANLRDTVIVDLNVAAPRLHSVFGTKLSPGLFESVMPGAGDIHISPTRINHLHVLPAGTGMGTSNWAETFGEPRRDNGAQGDAVPHIPTLGIEHVSLFRDVILTLKEKFEFVIVDVPSLNGPSVPLLLSHQIDGLLVVVNANRTHREDLDKMIRRLNEGQVLGFVYNRASGDTFA